MHSFPVYPTGYIFGIWLKTRTGEKRRTFSYIDAILGIIDARNPT
jgi:hypothetical protein